MLLFGCVVWTQQCSKMYHPKLCIYLFWLFPPLSNWEVLFSFHFAGCEDAAKEGSQIYRLLRVQANRQTLLCLTLNNYPSQHSDNRETWYSNVLHAPYTYLTPCIKYIIMCTMIISPYMYHDSIIDSDAANRGSGLGHNFIILFLILCTNSIVQLHDNHEDDRDENIGDGKNGDDDNCHY